MSLTHVSSSNHTFAASAEMRRTSPKGYLYSTRYFSDVFDGVSFLCRRREPAERRWAGPAVVYLLTCYDLPNGVTFTLNLKLKL